ncbi:Hypothetical protein, putative [Bodo saltans]|uniref:Uncharacterized protein n=1 Tax=Bodo saltans TaxID=75058 RepID=A0A0S4JEP7_BODSA|nr:Hypothetical protein, putative [Bodo saltans]|eukprot:CUG88449.1 Hypothetical protein, putative [Bodo saltans]
MDSNRQSPQQLNQTHFVVPPSHVSPARILSPARGTTSPGATSLNKSGRLLTAAPSLGDYTCSDASEFGVTMSSEGSSTFFMGNSMMKYSARSHTLSVTLTTNEGTGELLRSTVVDVGAVSQLWNGGGGCGDRGDSSSSQEEEGNGSKDGKCAASSLAPRPSSLLALQSVQNASARSKVNRRQSNPIESDATTSEDDDDEDADHDTVFYKPYQSLDPREDSDGHHQASSSSSSSSSSSNHSASPQHHHHNQSSSVGGALASKIRTRARAASSPTLKSHYGDPMSAGGASPFSDADYCSNIRGSKYGSLQEVELVPAGATPGRKQPQDDPQWSSLFPAPILRGGHLVTRPNLRSPLGTESDGDHDDEDDGDWVPGICVPCVSCCEPSGHSGEQLSAYDDDEVGCGQLQPGSRMSLKAALRAQQHDDDEFEANGPLQPD